jgi:aminopeptidase N
VTSHELAHTYFPFMVGTNERKYAWMDEAWAMFLPEKFQERELGGFDIYEELKRRFYDPVAGSEFDLPPMIPSVTYGSDVFYYYRYVSYARPYLAYRFLQQMMGNDFLPAFREYIRRWEGKHPMPYDFFFTFNDVSGENLNWFWKPWFFEIVFPDMGLKKKTRDKNGITVTITNEGGLPLPVKLTLTFADSTVNTVEKSVKVWQDGSPSFDMTIRTDKPVLQIVLGDSHIPDIRPEDNTLTYGEKLSKK